MDTSNNGHVKCGRAAAMSAIYPDDERTTDNGQRTTNNGQRTTDQFGSRAGARTVTPFRFDDTEILSPGFTLSGSV